MAALPGALAIKRLLTHSDTLRMLRADPLPLIAQGDAGLAQQTDRPGADPVQGQEILL